jgi:6-phosphogluconolactonase
MRSKRSQLVVWWCAGLLWFPSAGFGDDPPAVDKRPLVICSAAQDKKLVLFRLNSNDGTLEPAGSVATPGEPGALAVTPDGTRLMVGLRSTGQLMGFRFDKQTGLPVAKNVVEAGADPAQISVDATGRYLFTAYYVAGKVSVHAIADDGSLSPQALQEVPTLERAHAIVASPSGKQWYVPHTGPNTIFQFDWDAGTRRLTPHDPPRVDRPASTGPRHMVWHPSRPVAFTSDEQGMSVTPYVVDERGSLVPGKSVPTLDQPFDGPRSTAEIKVHPSGRFVYCSNRGPDSLAILRVDETGRNLSLVGTHPTERTPRSFDIDPAGTWLLSAGEASGQLRVSRIDRETGRLSDVGRYSVGPRLWWVMVVDSR